MTNILFVTSSPRGSESYSNRVAARVLEELRQAHPGAQVVVRDLAKNPIPHIDEDFVNALGLGDERRSECQRVKISRSDALVDELLTADIIVIASPMYNYGIPSTLKAWIDNVCRAGRTFSYTETGPKGLVNGKRAILIHSRGGVYSEGPGKPFEHQEAHLRSVLGLLGITDVESIDIEGIAYGAEAAAKSLAAGLHRAHEVAGADAAHA